MLLASVDGSGTRTWEIHDALGSVRQHLAADGSVVPGGSYAYTPFGVVASGNTPAPFGFTGELQSEGLVYLRARWYDPAVGAFTSRDPFAGFPTLPYSLHPYQYGYSAPVRFTDPSGQNPAYACLPIALADSPIPGPADAAAGVCFVLVGGAWFLGTWVMAQPGTQEFVQDAAEDLVSHDTAHPIPADPVPTVLDSPTPAEAFPEAFVFVLGFYESDTCVFPLEDGWQRPWVTDFPLVQEEGMVVFEVQDSSGGSNRGNLKVPKTKYWTDRGIDPHQVKADYLGQEANLKLFDLAKDNQDVVWLIRKSRQEGQFEPIELMTLDELIGIYGQDD